MATSKQETPSDNKIIALEAFEHVHKAQVSRYKELGQMIDDLVRDSEPGMLVHALTQHSENNTETVFRWLEVFENSKALEAHLDNPHVITHIDTLNNGILSDTTDIVIYAQWDHELTAYWQQRLSAANLRFASLESGFFLSR